MTEFYLDTSKKPVVFDASIFIHANYHILTSYVSEDMIDSKMLADKVIQQIEYIATKHFSLHPIHLVIDSKAFRYGLHDTYKGERASKNIDFKLVNKTLMHHFSCFKMAGLEADDIAYLFATKRDCILVSNDNDYLLMLRDGVELFKYRQEELISLDADQVLCEQILKVIDGCSGDNVPKIKLKRWGPSAVKKFVAKKSQLLEEHLMDLLDQGIITDWTRNHELVVYRLATYEKYLGKPFLDFYKTL